MIKTDWAVVQCKGAAGWGKVSYLVTSCQGGGRREFTMMP